jgi:hypothetical protein
MGAGGLLFVGRRPSPVVTVPSSIPGLGRDVDRAATLDRLRSQGALSESEYEALRRGL